MAMRSNQPPFYLFPALLFEEEVYLLLCRYVLYTEGNTDIAFVQRSTTHNIAGGDSHTVHLPFRLLEMLFLFYRLA